MENAIELLQSELSAVIALNAKLEAKIAALVWKADDCGDIVRAYRFKFNDKRGLVEVYTNKTRLFYAGKEYAPEQAPSDIIAAAIEADPEF